MATPVCAALSWKSFPATVSAMDCDARPAGPLLIFDLDGTLYRTESSFVRTMRSVYARHRFEYPGDPAILGMVGETFETFLDWLMSQGFRSERGTLHKEIARD